MIGFNLSRIEVTLPPQDVWFPPEGGKFFEYTSEDEVWMRPLGLGLIKKISKKIIYPQGYISDMTPDGTVTFKVCPEMIQYV